MNFCKDRYLLITIGAEAIKAKQPIGATCSAVQTPNNIGATVKCYVADQCLAQVSGYERTDLIGLVSVSVIKIQGVVIGWHCAKVQGHAELEIEKPE